MIIKRVGVSFAIVWCLLGTTVQAATTVISNVETKTGVRFHGKNPNESGHDIWNKPHNGQSNSGTQSEGPNDKENLPQTGESKSSMSYRVSGSFILASVLIGYFFNHKNKNNKDVS